MKKLVHAIATVVAAAIALLTGIVSVGAYKAIGNEKDLRPSLGILQKYRISCVYDSDGNKIDLFKMTDGGHYVPVQTDDYDTIYSAAQTWEPVADVTLPEGALYIDEICSGRYIAHKNSLFIMFDNGLTEEVKLRGGSWLNVYDTTITDPQTGTVYNTAAGVQLIALTWQPT